MCTDECPFHTWPLHVRVENSAAHWIGGRLGLRYSLPRIEPWFLCCPARRSDAVPTDLSWVLAFFPISSVLFCNLRYFWIYSSLKICSFPLEPRRLHPATLHMNGISADIHLLLSVLHTVYDSLLSDRCLMDSHIFRGLFYDVSGI
jgi:hypothetical protein